MIDLVPNRGQGCAVLMPRHHITGDVRPNGTCVPMTVPLGDLSVGGVLLDITLKIASMALRSTPAIARNVLQQLRVLSELIDVVCEVDGRVLSTSSTTGREGQDESHGTGGIGTSHSVRDRSCRISTEIAIATMTAPATAVRIAACTLESGVAPRRLRTVVRRRCFGILCLHWRASSGE